MLTPLGPADGEVILPLALLKARVRVLDTSEDGDIRRMRAQAIDSVERYSGCSLQSRQFQLLDKHFRAGLRLPIGPVSSVDAISYYAADGTDTPLVPEDWFFGAGVLNPAPSTRWPYSSGQDGSVRITFTAGFANAEAEAPMLIAAVEVAVAALFDNREAPDFTASMACADSYRMPGL